MSRRKNHQSGGDREVTVDATLEADLSVAEDAIAAYLEDPSATRRGRRCWPPFGSSTSRSSSATTMRAGSPVRRHSAMRPKDR